MSDTPEHIVQNAIRCFREHGELIDECDELRAQVATLTAEVEQLQSQRDNLLARIHRDGGQYLAMYGAVKAVADADLIVANLFAEVERKQAALVELIACYDHKNFKPGYMQRREDAWTAARRAVLPVGGEG